MPAECPKCGGRESVQITPNFFECTSVVLLGVVPPELSGAQQPIPDYRPCGHQFQSGEQVQTALCACGRHSIGNCNACERPLCGIHGSGGGEFLCSECAEQAKLSREADEREREQAAAIQREDRKQQLANAHVALRATSDPYEIAELIASGGEGNEWIEACVEAWKKLWRSDCLGAPDAELVRVRFRKDPLLPSMARERWRRAAWAVAPGDWATCVDETGYAWQGLGDSAVTESTIGKESARVRDKLYFEKTFRVQPGQVQQVKMAFDVKKLTRGDGATVKLREWYLQGGIAMHDVHDQWDLPELISEICERSLIPPE